MFFLCEGLLMRAKNVLRIYETNKQQTTSIVISDDQRNCVYESLELTAHTVSHEVRMLGDHTTATLPVSAYFAIQTKGKHCKFIL